MLIEIEKIKIKNRIRKDFGNIQELADDIRDNGLINPPVITPDTYELITGERRIRAMKLLGYKQIEVRPMAVKDAEHQLNLEISENEARKDFSKAERIDYARRLERIESLKAEKRMKAGKSDPMEIFPQGTTRDTVASKLGIGSGKQYEKEKYIVENQTSLTPEDFADWDEGKLSTNKAFKRIKEEKERLRKYYSIEGIKIKDRLSRSERAIYTQAYKLGLIASDIWTEEEIELLNEYYPIEGCEVEKRLNGRSKKAIMAQARRLKLTKKNAGWTKREDDIIKKYYQEEGGDIHKRLPGRSKFSCFTRARKLGVIKMEAGKLWTKEEAEILKNQYPIIGSDVADKLNRTKYACVSRAKALGIKYSAGLNKHKYIEHRCGKWRVGFWVNGKRKNFGTYENEDEAVKVALEKAKEYGKSI